MADAKKLLVEKAKELVALATSRSVRLPAGADGLGKAANALNTTKNGAEFDLDAALKSLVKQYGGDAELRAASADPVGPDLEAEINPNKKRKLSAKKEAELAAKKAAIEALPNKNPLLTAMFEELDRLVMKHGGENAHFAASTYRKVALLLREVEEPVTSGKHALKMVKAKELKGLGPKSMEMIDEFLTGGEDAVVKLQEFRAIDRGELPPHGAAKD